MSSEFTDIFLDLVRAGIGHKGKLAVYEQIDWHAIEYFANEQGLSAVVVDGIERLPAEQRPPKLVLLQWIGETLQDYDYRYEQYRKAIVEMASFYNQHDLKMMVLKGYACSLDWPKPEHRPSGDIDIWQFGLQKDADAVLAQVKGVKVDNYHHHHTIFFWGDFMVENHYDFINVHHHKSNIELEKVFKELGKDDSHFVEVADDLTGTPLKVYLPSPNLNALFLLRHTMVDFVSGIAKLRQVLDWAFFNEKHGSEVDWACIMPILEQFHMMEFFNCLNAICIEDLGFEVGLFQPVQFDPIVKGKVLQEIINPSFSEEEPKSLLRRLSFKYRRWKSNSWKHEMCYKESMWSAFCSGVWSHLLKPKSI